MARSPYLTGLGSVKPTQQGLDYFNPGPVSPAAFGGAIAEGLGGLGEAFVDVGLKTQGPLDVTYVQQQQLDNTLGIENWVRDNAATADQPDYPQRAATAFRQITEANAKKAEAQGYRPSTRAKNAVGVDNLQLYKSYGVEVIGQHDTARRTMAITGTDQNLEKARAIAISTGNMEELNKQTSFGLHAARATLSPEDFAKFEADQKEKNGLAVLAHLDALQEQTLRPGTSVEDLDSALTQGQAEMDRAISLGWIDASKGKPLEAKWEENFRTGHFNALTPDEQQKYVTSGTGPAGHDITAPAGSAFQFSAQGAMRGLQARGLSAQQAAVVAGNWQQESSFNTGSHNVKEGAIGLDQWRLSRRTALLQFAKDAGKDWRDPEVQMDFFIKEFKEDYPRAYHRFVTATSLEEMNAAVKQYINYGDTSQGTRLANARNILGGGDLTSVGSGEAVVGGTQQLTGPYAGLSSDRQREMIDQMYTNLRQQENQRQAELTRFQTANRERLGLALSQMASGGPAVLPVQVEEMRQGGLIDDGQAASAIDKINEINGYSAAVNRAVGEANAGAVWNPFDTDETAKANTAYDYLSKNVPRDQLGAFTDNYVQQHGVMPSTVTASIQRGLASMNPQEYMAAAQTAVHYANTASRALNATTDGQAIAKQAAIFTRLQDLRGTEAAAASLAKQNDPEIRVNEGVLKDTLEKQLTAMKGNEIFQTFDTSWLPFIGTPNVDTQEFLQGAVADWKALYRDEFYKRRGGDPTAGGEDIKAATQVAFNNIYGLTSVGMGGRTNLVKFPIEKAPGYPLINGSHNYVTENITQEVLNQNGSLDNVTGITLLPMQDGNASTAGDWTVKQASIDRVMRDPSQAPDGRNPRYLIQYTTVDPETGYSRVQLVKGAWMMTDAEINSSQEKQLETAKRSYQQKRERISGDKLLEREQKLKAQSEQLNKELGVTVTPEPPPEPLRPVESGPPADPNLLERSQREYQQRRLDILRRGPQDAN